MATKKSTLGKGLSALIASSEMSGTDSPYKEKFDIEKISPNPYQPRMNIDPAELVEIADSIRENGVIQPLIITKNPDGPNYYIIAGERRFRASKLAGLKHVPVVIKDSSPQEMLELALIENIQRQDLNPLEEATAFKQLQDQFGLTQTDISKKMGLSRVAITNKIRLLALPSAVQEYVLNQDLSEGHARALLGISDDSSLVAAANIIVKKKLSVRETEELVRKINFGKDKAKNERIEFDHRTRKALERISERLGYTTRLTRMSKGGKLTIRYLTNSELTDLLKKLAE
ncbi:ParB/RepB/Spo0J family partition protein [Candidatus Nomurabacteria bacterium]|uniref:ParB/RepB/Spo0J family partition protein n=1 Tax=Candidatus Dojkabacteria bacterium TaxID=2099670 RepID=A0A955I1X1_9BACT|nr:ParB/RepB/Spo0J family partition protein [Candidatus Dojkabacteria bacterium]MCB9790156.1 ParB/RepB/Spo0J family partition protein [Candidatus Nomurabacteria bacterium]MCB9803324.1 ParB/RepB/Spo0J family partition protein [Candidatus Nomurabacteria bacterium]